MARLRAANADIPALERLATPALFELPGRIERQPSYLAAGSFVGFLIARHGLDRFRSLYALTPFVPGRRNAGEIARWQAVYGASIEQLATEWHGRLHSPR
jgi:hypothetical protein